MKQQTTITLINLSEAANYIRFCAVVNRYVAVDSRRSRLRKSRKGVTA